MVMGGDGASAVGIAVALISCCGCEQFKRGQERGGLEQDNQMRGFFKSSYM